MKIYIGELKENYYYSVYNLLKMLYPDIEVVKGKRECEISYEFEIDEEKVTVKRKGRAYIEKLVENNVPLTIKRLIYIAECIKLPFGVMTGIRPAKTVLEYEENQKEILRNVYFVNEKKAEIACKCATVEKELSKKMKRKTVSLYVNIPFCPTRCDYCSFTMSNVKITRELIDNYFSALMRELEFTAEFFRENAISVHSVYVGGGTPTILNEKQLDALSKKIKERFSGFCEFTVEAGRPDTINFEKMSILYKNGVTGLSINPQSLNQKTLDAIGRKHTVEQFFEAYENAKKAGFENINTDIIAGLQGEDIEDFKNTVNKIFSLSPHSVTVHTLCKKRTADMEKSTVYNSKEIGKMLDYAYKTLENSYCPYYVYRQKNAIGSYENTGFAKDENFCEYNVIMMEEIGNVVAVGAGGTSKLIDFDEKIPFSKFRTEKQAHTYIEKLDEILKNKKAFLKDGLTRI